VATYEDNKIAYIANPIEDGIGANFDLTFKMKTTQKEALLIFAANSDQVLWELLRGKIDKIADTIE